MLKRMYRGDNGSTKQDLMEYGDLITIFFGCEEKGKEITPGICLIDNIIIANKRGQLTRVKIYLGVRKYVKFEFISMATLGRTLLETLG
jgi:hypothetical protein